MKQLTNEVFAQVRGALEQADIYLEEGSQSHSINRLAIAALDAAQSVPEVNAMLVEALEAAENLEHEALVALSEATYELKVGNTYTTATDTYNANNDLIHRLDKILNSQSLDRNRAALAAAQQAQPALSGCACRWDADDKRVATCVRHQGWLDVVSEWAERAKAAESQQAQPERAPLSEAELEQEFCNITGLETGINPAAADTKRALVWFKKGYANGIRQGGQHD